MPELPEVETIRSQLEKYLPATIEKVKFSNAIGSILKEKKFSPKGSTITTISRKGKLLNMKLGDNGFLLSHLGMSGSWRVSKTPISEKHCHVHFQCNQGNLFLGYVDPRRFGNIYITDKDGAEKQLKKLGPDVSTADFTAEYLYSITQKRPKWQIKPLLLEQKLFSGVGNYMASEICAYALIAPTRKAKDISLSDAHRIIAACKTVIDGSLKTNGLTFSGGYSDTTGQPGEGVKNLVVFHQKTCQLCHRSSIIKIIQKGRSTFYCPSCQID